MKIKNIVSVVSALSIACIGDTPVRIVDTVADLANLYPNVDQPAVIVRGLSVRDDWSPPKVFFWNPDSTAATNDYTQPVRFGVGRWINTTNITFDGAARFGSPGMFGTLTLRGFASGVSGIVMERSGVGTNGISIAGGTISLRREDPGASRFIATFAEDTSFADMFLGGNSSAGFTNGRTGRIFAPSSNASLTNEQHQAGGDLYLSPGIGTGTNGSTSKIQFIAVDPTAAGSTNVHVRRTMAEIKMPQVLNEFTHNTAWFIYAYTNNGSPFFQRWRMVLTNASGSDAFMTPRFYLDP